MLSSGELQHQSFHSSNYPGNRQSSSSLGVELDMSMWDEEWMVVQCPLSFFLSFFSLALACKL